MFQQSYEQLIHPGRTQEVIVIQDYDEWGIHRSEIIDQAPGQDSHRDGFHLLQHGLHLDTDLWKHLLYRSKEVLQKDTKIAVAFIQRHPGRWHVRRLQPMGHSRALAITRRRGHKGQRHPQTRIHPVVQRLTANEILRLRRPVELGANDRVHLLAVEHGENSLLSAISVLQDTRCWRRHGIPWTSRLAASLLRLRPSDYAVTSRALPVQDAAAGFALS